MNDRNYSTVATKALIATYCFSNLQGRDQEICRDELIRRGVPINSIFAMVADYANRLADYAVRG